MSQIHKYQKGGQTENVPTFGTLTIDHKPMQMDQAGIEAWARNWNGKEGREYVGQFIDWLKQGHDVSFDTNTGDWNVSGVDKNEAFDKLNFNNRQRRVSETGGTRVGNRLSATVEGRSNQFGKFVRGNQGFNYGKSEPQKKYTNINFENRNLYYKKDKEGNTSWANDDFVNNAILSDINNYLGHLREGDNSSYKISGLRNEEAIKNAYNSNSNYFDELINRVKSNSLTDVDKNNLRLFNVNVSDTPTIKTRDEIDSENQQKLSDSNTKLDNAIKNIGIKGGLNFIHKNGWEASLDNNGNVIFSGLPEKAVLHDWEGFVDTPFNEGVIYNNRFYTQNETMSNPEVYNVFQNFRQIWADENGLSFDQKLQEVKNKGYQMYYDKNPYFQIDFNNQYVHRVSEYINELYKNLKDKNFQLANWTGHYNLPENTSIYSYILPTSANQNENYWNIPTRQYVYVDSHGAVSPIQSNEYPERNDWMNVDISWTPLTKDGYKYANKTLYDNQTNQPNYIYSKDKDYYIRQSNGEFVRIKNNNLLNELLSSPNSIKRLDIQQLLRSSKSLEDVKAEKTANLVRGVTNRGMGGLKHGGLIPKHISGAKVKSLNQQGREIGPTQEELSKKNTIEKSVNLKDIGKTGALTNADIAELSAVALDILSMGTGMTTGGGNPVAAAIGAAGSLTQFGADVSRDGMDWGDWGRLAVGLGLDALTVAPIVGSWAKAGKLAKGFRRVGKGLGAAFTAAGMTGLANTVSELNDKGWKEIDSNDLRSIAVGIQSLWGIKRLSTDKYLATTKGQKRNLQKIDSNITKNTAEIDKIKKDFATKKIKELKESGEWKDVKSDLKTERKVGKEVRLENDFNKIFTKYADESLKTQVNKLEEDKVSKATAFFANKGNWFKKSFSAEWKPRDARNTDRQATSWFDKLLLNQQKRAKGRYIVNNPDRIFSLDEKGNRIYPFKTGTKSVNTYGKETDDWGTIIQKQTGIATNSPIGRRTMSTIGEHGPISIEKKQIILLPEGKKSIVQEPIINQVVPVQTNISNQKNVSEVLSQFNPKSYDKVKKSITNQEKWMEYLKKLYFKDHNTVNQIRTNINDFQNIANNPSTSQLDRSNAIKLMRDEMKKLQQLNRNLSGYLENINKSKLKTDKWKNSLPKSIQQLFGYDKSLRYMKEGGVIPQYQNGYLLPEITVTDKKNPPLFKSGLVHDKYQIDKLIMPQDRIKEKEMILNNIVSSPNSNVSNSWKSSVENPFTFPIDKDTLLSGARLWHALRKNKRSYDITNSALNKAGSTALQNVPEIYDRFTDYGVNAAYRQASQKQSQFKPVTSNSLLAIAGEHAAKTASGQLELEGRMKSSELFANHLQRNIDAKRRYAEMRTNIANQNMDRANQITMAKAQNKAGKVLQDFQSIENFALQMQNRLNQDREKYNNYDRRLNLYNLQSGLETITNRFLSNYNDAWQSEVDKARFGNDQLEWLRQTNLPEYEKLQDLVNAEKLRLEQDYINNDLKNNWWRKSLPSIAKGGKVYTPTEQIWIDQNKAVHKAVQQLNKNVITLFLKASSK